MNEIFTDQQKQSIKLLGEAMETFAQAAAVAVTETGKKLATILDAAKVDSDTRSDVRKRDEEAHEGSRSNTATPGRQDDWHASIS